MEKVSKRTVIYEVKNSSQRNISKDIVSPKPKSDSSNSAFDPSPINSLALKDEENFSATTPLSNSVKRISQLFEKNISKETNLEESLPTEVNRTKTPKNNISSDISPFWRIIQTLENSKESFNNENKTSEGKGTVLTTKHKKKSPNVSYGGNVQFKSNEKGLLVPNERNKIESYAEMDSSLPREQKWSKNDVKSYREKSEKLSHMKKFDLTQNLNLELKNDKKLKDVSYEKKPHIETNTEIYVSKDDVSSSRNVASLIKEYHKFIEKNKTDNKPPAGEKMNKQTENCKSPDEITPSTEIQAISNNLSEKIRTNQNLIDSNQLFKSLNLSQGDDTHYACQIPNGNDESPENSNRSSVSSFKLNHYDTKGPSASENYLEKEKRLSFRLELENTLSRRLKLEKVDKNFAAKEAEQLKLTSNDHANSQESTAAAENCRDFFSYKLGKKSTEEEISGWEKVEDIEFIGKENLK